MPIHVMCPTFIILHLPFQKHVHIEFPLRFFFLLVYLESTCNSMLIAMEPIHVDAFCPILPIFLSVPRQQYGKFINIFNIHKCAELSCVLIF